MKILILEDNDSKYADLVDTAKNVDTEIEFARTKDFSAFTSEINREKFDLIIVDLMVPQFRDSKEPQDISGRLPETIRDLDCINFRTPVLAVTGYDSLAEENFSALNKLDITVITYTQSDNGWKASLSNKIATCAPKLTVDFVIICALEKEANAYVDAGYGPSVVTNIGGLKCRSISIGQYKGLIVVPARMGLVNAAIATTRAIDLFSPRLVCMSGICAGIEGKAKIYDVIVPEICHQHDSGKWEETGFVPELYSIQLPHLVSLKLAEIISQKDFLQAVTKDVVLGRDEFPSDMQNFSGHVYLAPTSSGSSVVADDTMTQQIASQHRKSTAFEMEAYALYESARQSLNSPLYFSAKSVVDNGTSDKGDKFHRVACLLSAKTVYQLIYRGILD